MKTQLLEDIGENAALPLAPSHITGNAKAGRDVRTPAPQRTAEPATPRVAPVVPGQAPASEPLISRTQQPAQDLSSLELDSVFEEIAALEAQLVAPGQLGEPVDTIAPVEPAQALSSPAVAPEPQLVNPAEEIAALEAELVAPGQLHEPENTIAPVEPRQALSTPVVAPEQQPANPAEEIAALEAQLVAPVEQQHAPVNAIAPVGPRQALSTPAAAADQPAAPTAERLHEPAAFPVEPRNRLASPPAERLLQAAASGVEPLRKPAVPPAEFPHTLAVLPAGRLLQASAPPAAPLHTPAPPAAEPLPEAVASPADPLANPVVAPAAFLQTPAPRPTAPTPAVNPLPSAPVPQDPLFDFTPPPPAPQAADPFTRPPSGLTRSGRRYLLWGACALSGALLLLGGRWLYQERNDAGSLALIAEGAKETPRADAAVKPVAIAANEATLGPEAEVRAAPTVPASRPPSGVPPLVLLEPEPSVTAKREQPEPSATDRAEPEAPPKPEPVAQPKAASPIPKPTPKPSSRTVRERSNAAAQPARERNKREPVRQPARTAAVETERPAEVDTSMTATLKACRERGYGPAQCVKRGCSVTKYGFACRGR